jgi:hypothetical protein
MLLAKLVGVVTYLLCRERLGFVFADKYRRSKPRNVVMSMGLRKMSAAPATRARPFIDISKTRNDEHGYVFG